MQITTWISNTFIYDFFYNALIGLANLFPGASIALGVIVLTILVKLLLSPLTYKSIMNQIAQKKLQPLLSEIKEKYPDKQEQSQKIMELYKEHKTNPFSGCLLILIQLPIIFALYAVFLQGLEIVPDNLYAFVRVPESLHLGLFGIDMASKSLILAIVAGLSQFVQLHLSPAMQDSKKEKEIKTESKQGMPEEMAQNMQKSMKYAMPVMIGVFGYLVPSAVALYWTVSNIFTILQEIVIRKRVEKKEAQEKSVEKPAV